MRHRAGPPALWPLAKGTDRMPASQDIETVPATVVEAAKIALLALSCGSNVAGGSSQWPLCCEDALDVDAAADTEQGAALRALRAAAGGTWHCDDIDGPITFVAA